MFFRKDAERAKTAMEEMRSQEFQLRVSKPMPPTLHPPIPPSPHPPVSSLTLNTLNNTHN
jgi:hypothetical protein